MTKNFNQLLYHLLVFSVVKLNEVENNEIASSLRKASTVRFGEANDANNFTSNPVLVESLALLHSPSGYQPQHLVSFLFTQNFISSDDLNSFLAFRNQIYFSLVLLKRAHSHQQMDTSTVGYVINISKRFIICFGL